MSVQIQNLYVHYSAVQNKQRKISGTVHQNTAICAMEGNNAM